MLSKNYKSIVFTITAAFSGSLLAAPSILVSDLLRPGESSVSVDFASTSGTVTGIYGEELEFEQKVENQLSRISLKMGINDKLNLNVSLPYTFNQRVETTLGDGFLQATELSNGVNDLEVGILYKVDTYNDLDFIFDFAVSIPTSDDTPSEAEVIINGQLSSPEGKEGGVGTGRTDVTGGFILRKNIGVNAIEFGAGYTFAGSKVEDGETIDSADSISFSGNYLLPLSHNVKFSINALLINEFESESGGSTSPANQSYTLGGGLYTMPRNNLLLSIIGGYFYNPGFKIKDSDGNTEISYKKFTSPLIAVEMAYSF